jgi:hypothetical protein
MSKPCTRASTLWVKSKLPTDAGVEDPRVDLAGEHLRLGLGVAGPVLDGDPLVGRQRRVGAGRIGHPADGEGALSGA